jgi:hypothetical protein
MAFDGHAYCSVVAAEQMAALMGWVPSGDVAAARARVAEVEAELEAAREETAGVRRELAAVEVLEAGFVYADAASGAPEEGGCLMVTANQFASVDFNTAATQTLVAAVAGKRIYVVGCQLYNGVATAQTVQFKSGSNLLTGVESLPSSIGGGFVLPLAPEGRCWFSRMSARR